jgi:hypothetical protein
MFRFTILLLQDLTISAANDFVKPTKSYYINLYKNKNYTHPKKQGIDLMAKFRKDY